MIVTVTLNPSLDEWIQLPELRLGRLNRASGFVRYPGGKGINVSRVIRELGGHTVALGIAGGEDGLILRELMNRMKIRHELISVAGSTRNNYKIHTRHPRTLTEINAEGPAVPAAILRRLERRLLTRRPTPRCVVLSGSLPPGVPVSVYQRWIRAFQRRSIPTVLDSSGSALRYGLSAAPWLLKPNRQEAEELLRRPLKGLAGAVQGVQQLRCCGPSVVILSLGKDGALLASSSVQGVWLARPPIVKIGSAVGAGDSLVGGFLVGWTKGQPVLEAFRLGIACGTATSMTSGTELCHRADVQRLVRRVELRRVG